MRKRMNPNSTDDPLLAMDGTENGAQQLICFMLLACLPPECCIE